MASKTPPRLRTAPVLAVLVCHDGDQWLGTALSALRRQRPRPRHVIAVDTGSLDRTSKLLAEAADGPDRVIDGVLTMPRGTGFGAAVHAAVDHAVQRWGDPGKWLWLLHDDCAPEPDCLASLLTAAELSPGAAVLGPLSLDWSDPRLVVEAGVSTDASGQRQTGLGPAELDWSRFGSGFEQSTETLAVSSAGSLIRRKVWHDLDGYDRVMPMLREDIDFGWRANRAGHLVLSVPVARMRHVRAASRGVRRLDAAAARPGPLLRGVDRAHGLRTFLVNCSRFSFAVGLPRLAVLAVLRAFGLLLLRRLSDAQAELGALRYVLSGRARLLAGRAARRATADPRQRTVRGLFTSRTTRSRNAIRALSSYLIRRRVEADAALGRLPVDEGRPSAWLPPPSEKDGQRKVVGPQALPAGVLGRGHPVRATGGLRRPAMAVPVATDAQLSPALRPSPRPRPSPMPRSGRPKADVVFVEVDRARVLRSLLIGPPLLLVLGLVVFALVANASRLGFDLAGGRLLPVSPLGEMWSSYLAAWHPVAGGTTSPAPASEAVLGSLGVVFGGPSAVVAILLLGDAPLAGLAAYVASRGLRVRRPVRAVVAAAYALLPAATSAVSQGRLDVVVVHVLAPLVFAGVVAVLRGNSGRSWLPIASGTAFAIAAMGAFSPLMHLLVLIGALIGFVVVPGRPGEGRRRVAGLFAVVLVPMALLLPWPAVVLQHPVVVLHGTGAFLETAAVRGFDLVALRPGGPGALPLVGAVVLVAALGALVLRPSRAMLPGIAVVVLAVLAGAALLAVPMTPLAGGPAQYGWTGGPLVVLGWGLLWVVLAACGRDGPVAEPAVRRLVSLAGVLAVLALGCSGLIGLRQGPLRTDGGPRLPSTVAQELPRTGRAVLVLGVGGEPTRQVAGRMPRFGDDDLVPMPSASGRLERWTRELTGGSPDSAKVALAQAATSGVAFVVLPDKAAADRLRTAVGDLVGDAPPMSDGRPLLRVQLAAGNAVLLSPELARRARSGGNPPTELGAPGIAPVEAELPDVGVRVSDGPEGRLLVLAAEDEPAWRVTVDGRQAPVVRAWGHLVGVSVPTAAADVRVEVPSSLRELLLLVQAAAALFTLLTAIPSRHR